MADARVRPLEQEGEVLLSRERGLWRDAFRRLSQNRLAMGSLVVLVAIILLVFVGSQFEFIERYSPRAQDYSAIHEAPSMDHYLGTDNLGRDTWSRRGRGV